MNIQSALHHFHSFEREPMLCLPTPLHHLNALSHHLKADLWIKRDDLTGLAMGGNKGRKLEYLMADARKQGADCIVACGAVQSNHARQAAAAAKRCGMDCVLVLLGEPSAINGNLLLERWLSAEQVFVGAEAWNQRDPEMWDLLDDKLHETTERLKTQGRKPYLIPLGGSAPLGAMGFVNAVIEMQKQLEAIGRPPFDSIVFASSSGGTQTGLQLGCQLLQLPPKLIGIGADPEDIRPEIVQIANGARQLLRLEEQVSEEDFILEGGYIGEGYAIPTAEANRAIRLMAQLEGIYLDPVYSGKAMAGLIDLAQKGALTGSTLFWHTGGVPALFAEEYAELV